MPLHIQNRADFEEPLRGVLDRFAGGEWEYCSVDEKKLPEGATHTVFIIYDAAGNELKTIYEKKAAAGEPSYSETA